MYKIEDFEDIIALMEHQVGCKLDRAYIDDEGKVYLEGNNVPGKRRTDVLLVPLGSMLLIGRFIVGRPGIGNGTRLLNLIHEWAKDRGIETIVLDEVVHAIPELKRLATKFGYAPMSTFPRKWMKRLKFDYNRNYSISELLRSYYSDYRVQGILPVNNALFVWHGTTVDKWEMVGDLIPVDVHANHIMTTPDEVSKSCTDGMTLIDIAGY